MIGPLRQLLWTSCAQARPDGGVVVEGTEQSVELFGRYYVSANSVEYVVVVEMIEVESLRGGAIRWTAVDMETYLAHNYVDA